MYKVGDRVIIKANRLSIKSRINGQVCRIKNIIMFHGNVFWYELEWLLEDNPGKEFTFNVHQISWYAHEFLSYRPPVSVALKGLPDV